MAKDKPRVVVTRKLPDVIETRMMELFDVQLNLTDTPMPPEVLIATACEADVLVPTVTDRLDAAVLKRIGGRLKMIANYGAGVDNIDVTAAHKRGLIVTNTPDVLTEDTAEMTLALILAAPRRLIEGERVLREGEWQGWSPTWMLGHRVTGKRLGIVGMGRIGQAVARRARAFDMAIHYHNRKRVHPDVEEELDATYHESLDQMLARMDIVTIHCPHTPATYHLLSARRLQLLQPHAYLINTARGEIIDEPALIRLLRTHAIAGAALDVFEHEPALDPRLLALDNVVLLPHMASSTIEGRIGMGECVVINIKSVLDGHAPPNRVLPEDIGF